MLKYARKKLGELSLWFSEITERPLLATFMVFVFMLLLMLSVSFRQFLYNYEQFSSNLMAEGFGTVFDLLVIGIFLLWINKLGERKALIRGYQEEIDDFRNWNNDEAMFKIVGSIKRLNKHKIHQLELYECHMRNAKLEYINLAGSNLNFTDLSQSNLMGADMSGIRANQVDFDTAKLNEAIFRKAMLAGANFNLAVAIRADFSEAMLIKTNFSGAMLMEACFHKAQLIEADFSDANLYKADLRGVLGLTVEQLSKAKTLQKAQMDELLEAELEVRFPWLFREEGAVQQKISLNPD
jgi:BTB/POZ domain-containing protein KCTD9